MTGVWRRVLRWHLLCRALDERARLQLEFLEMGVKKLSLIEFESLRVGARVLETDAYGEKVLWLADGRILKLFRRKRKISSAAWYPYAKRFADNCKALAEKGFLVPKVDCVCRVDEIQRDIVIYQPLPGVTLRERIISGANSEEFPALQKRFQSLVEALHDSGIYFRSLHLGNVVLLPDGQLGLIDVSDMSIHRRALGGWLRRRNLQRIRSLANKGEENWIVFN